MDIKAILKRIAEGDQTAFALVVVKFQQPLFGYLGRLGLTQSLAEEVAQETFLRAWKQLHRFDPACGEFSTWLFSIARHLGLHELERAYAKHELANDETLAEFAAENLPLSDALNQALLKQRLFQALHSLPVTDRSALALAYYQDLDLDAIARIEGCSSGAIKVRLHRAKQRLRQLLEEK